MVKVRKSGLLSLNESIRATAGRLSDVRRDLRATRPMIQQLATNDARTEALVARIEKAAT